MERVATRPPHILRTPAVPPPHRPFLLAPPRQQAPFSNSGWVQNTLGALRNMWNSVSPPHWHMSEGPMTATERSLSDPRPVQLTSYWKDYDPDFGARNTVFGYDRIAAAATEMLRDSYNPVPTAGGGEFAAFFSAPNVRVLHDRVTAYAGYEPAEDDLLNEMIRAYTTIRPRSDITDFNRRMYESAAITRSYVEEMNEFVLDNLGELTKQANLQAEHYVKYRYMRGANLPEAPIDDSVTGIGQQYDGTYMMP